jgi:hypothetical protein
MPEKTLTGRVTSILTKAEKEVVVTKGTEGTGETTLQFVRGKADGDCKDFTDEQLAELKRAQTGKLEVRIVFEEVSPCRPISWVAVIDPSVEKPKAAIPKTTRGAKKPAGRG